MSAPTIEMRAVGNLKPWAKNARTHSTKQIRQIADSIETFGFTNPILIDGQSTMLAGHGRLEAARLLRMTHVPCVCLDHLSPEQKRAYVLADNKLALNAGWDEQLLAEELQDLISADLDFDLSLTGFSIAEIDLVIEGYAPEEPGNPEDDILPDEDIDLPECRIGDIWQLGPHRLICGDALDPITVDMLMNGEQARMRPTM